MAKAYRRGGLSRRWTQETLSRRNRSAAARNGSSGSRSSSTAQIRPSNPPRSGGSPGSGGPARTPIAGRRRRPPIPPPPPAGAMPAWGIGRREPRLELDQGVGQRHPRHPRGGHHLGEGRLRRLHLGQHRAEGLERPNQSPRAAACAAKSRAERLAARRHRGPGSFVATASTPDRMSTSAAVGSSTTQVPSEHPECVHVRGPGRTRGRHHPGERQHPWMPLLASEGQCDRGFHGGSVSSPVMSCGSRSRAHATDHGLKLHDGSREVHFGQRVSTASTTGGRPSKSGSPGMVLISTSNPMRPDTSSNVSRNVGTCAAPSPARTRRAPFLREGLGRRGQWPSVVRSTVASWAALPRR